MHRMLRLAAAALTALAPAALLTASVAPATAAPVIGGSFAFLNYNVAGLPVVHEPPTTLSMEDAATAIGSRLGPYDIVHLQEDFNYHAYIYAADSHPYRTATSGPAGIGDGLNTVSNYSFEDFQRVTWTSCYPDNGDCLTPKGFSFMRIRLAQGVYVDFYNLHLNAGTSSGDETAREAEWQQLTSYIQSTPSEDAIIVAGDTNSRYTRTADDLQSFVADNGLTDAWVQLELGGTAPAAGSPDLVCDEAAITNTCEVTNKFLYRSSKWVTLNATSYNNDHAKFLDSNGLMLSDMDPILTDVSWTENPSYQASDEFGGTGGTEFNDITSIPGSASVSSLSLSTGNRVDNIGLTLSNGTTFAHGGTGGMPATLTMGSGEYPVSLNICQASYNSDNRLFYAQWTTNLGRTLSGGTTTSDCTTFTAPSGYEISGFYGRSGSEVDQLGVFYTKAP